MLVVLTVTKSNNYAPGYFLLKLSNTSLLCSRVCQGRCTWDLIDVCLWRRWGLLKPSLSHNCCSVTPMLPSRWGQTAKMASSIPNGQQHPLVRLLLRYNCESMASHSMCCFLQMSLQSVGRNLAPLQRQQQDCPQEDFQIDTRSQVLLRALMIAVARLTICVVREQRGKQMQSRTTLKQQGSPSLHQPNTMHPAAASLTSQLRLSTL